MKNKKSLSAIILLIIAVAAGVIIFSLTSDNQEPETTVAQNESQQSVTDEGAQKESSTEPQSKETSSQAPEDSKSAEYIGGYYYLFNDEGIYCYVLSFKDDGEVDIAFLNEENIYDGDPQFYKGYSTYSVNESKITILDLSNPLPDKSIELEIKDGELYFGDKRLEKDSKLSLDKVNAHFV